SATNTNPCFDSSPTFLETPSNVICAGTNFKLNHHAYDPDGDSLVFSFGEALDTVSLVASGFNPPTNPAFVPYAATYSANSPTPGASWNPANIPATIDPQTGEISFTSYTQGSYVVVVRVQSWRCGQLISEVFRETQIIIVNCSGNNLPVITPPFGASFNTTVYAGQTVTFNLTVTDTDLLQDGSPQTITLNATGNQFGAGFTNPAVGCDQAPCATLNTGLPGSATSSITRTFNWQTDCSHLTNTICGQTAKVFQFVFRASDDFCPAPGVSTATVSVTVLPPQAVGAPEMKCADVALNGDVTLTWVPPVDPMGSFIRYEIYNTTLGSLVGTILTLGTNSFTHIGADAQNGSMSYCIKVYSGCSGLTNVTVSDTISSMFLTVNNIGTGVALLNWNKLLSPAGSTAYPYYDIWREYPLGTWTMIATTPYGTESYKDTISICDDTINYRVSVADSSGCISFSSIDGDRFTDLTEPYTPVISYVTVDTATGLTVINWFPNGAQDTDGYIILQNVGGSWIVVDTVYGINNTTYVPPGSDPFASSEAYGVAAFDTCWHGSPAAPNTSPMGTPHTTIHLTSLLHICDSSVALNWTPYSGWTTGVLTYEIYASENGGAYVLVASLPGSSTSFLHTNLNRLSTYKYIINAVSNGLGVNSISNISIEFINAPDIPAFAYIQTVTVIGPNEILMRFLPDVSAQIQYHKVFRSDDNGASFNQIGIINPGASPLLFTDTDVNTNLQSYVYKVVTVDSCGKDAITSNQAKTIFLQVIANSVELSNGLNWNPYSIWDGNVSRYDVNRSMDFSSVYSMAGSVLPGVSSYDDDVSAYGYTTGEFCYQVVAVENTNSYGISETSESNKVCVSIDPLVYVPNAFTPGGLNPIFKPVVSYVDYTNYQFEIYNRWGEVIFNSFDVNIGWDGMTKRGKVAKEDVYVYRVAFKTGEGRDVIVKGHVTLLDYGK
ncbi:MAG TPA: gliding motility-associated C-terminal domain-containing protein, partial [Flavobacteriales bacterium]|nr:gliding motility-associated C-terminal domain-containing protein [Flavobacteriales bacterium]